MLYPLIFLWSLQLNKIIISALASLLAGFSLSAYSYEHVEYTEFYPPHSGASAPAGDFETRARVIHAEPVYETVTVNRPVTECWIEQRTSYASQPDRRVAAGVIGGILGGVAGHQVGRGRGRDVATVAGSVLGATIGYNMGSRPGYYEQEVCETLDRFMTEERVRGYRVEYHYQDQVFVTHTDKHPGQWIRLKVNVTPT